MENSDSIAKLTDALAKAQVCYLPVKRTLKVSFPTKVGQKEYNYAPLEEVIEATRKALSDNGLAIMQPTKIIEGKLIVETLLSHNSGEWIKGEILIESQDASPQSKGSALTYARRYALSSMLGVASEEDDDAERAMSEKAPPENKVKAQPAKETGHYCSIHQQVFFKKGRMPVYAHPIKDANSQPILDEKGKQKWCNEVKDEKVKSTTETVADAQEGNIPEPETIDLSWDSIRAIVKKLYDEHRPGWSANEMLKKLADLEADISTRKVDSAYNTLHNEGKKQFISLVKEADKEI